MKGATRTAGLIIDGSLRVVEFLGNAGPYLDFAAGQSSLRLEKLLPAPLRHAVVAGIEDAKRAGVAVRVPALRYRRNSHSRTVDVSVTPTPAGPAGSDRFEIVFRERAPASRGDRTARRPKKPATDSPDRDLRQALEVAEAELEDARGAERDAARGRQESDEQRETTAAEFEQANAELEATNEELRLALAEKERTEDELRDERDFVEAVLRTIGAMVFVVDARGRVVKFNAACERVTGYSSNEVLGRSARGVLLAPEADREAGKLFRRIKAGSSIDDFENDWLRSKDGRRVEGIWSSAALRNSLGEPTHVIVAGLDVTERNKARKIIEESRDQIRRLVAKVLRAQSDEARRIARLLHDGLSQDLAALGLRLGLLAERPPETAAALVDQLRDLERAANDFAERARLLSHEIHPAALDQLGFVPALKSFCAEAARRGGVPIEVKAAGWKRSLSRPAAAALYRVAQEAVRNAVKHSRSERIDVELKRADGRALLTVSDRGVGFTPETAHGAGGLGLVTMRESALGAGGEVTVRSRPAEGTRVECRIPADEAAADGRSRRAER